MWASRAPPKRSSRGPTATMTNDDEDDVLELNDELAPAADLGPPLIDESVAGASRSALAQLSTVAASIPAAPPPANPLEEMVREMLRPILKQWLDDHLPRLVDEHVKREISRITGGRSSRLRREAWLRLRHGQAVVLDGPFREAAAVARLMLHSPHR